MAEKEPIPMIQDQAHVLLSYLLDRELFDSAERSQAESEARKKGGPPAQHAGNDPA
jgi:hypothetical protein